MLATRIVALATLAAAAACSLPPEPGAPAPTGITSSRGGGTQSVGQPTGTGAISTTTTPVR